MIDQIDIWFANVDMPVSESINFEFLLSPEEIVRARRFRFQCDRKRYLVKHGFLRQLLASYTGLIANRINIGIALNGKPYLKDCVSEIHFSTSRSESVAAFAFSRSGATGIDIERISPIADMSDIVKRYFTPNEKHEIFSSPENLWLSCFYRIWTRKEAFLKALGDGLLLQLDSVDVSSAVVGTQPCEAWAEGSGAVKEIFVADLEGPQGYMAAVASAEPLNKIVIKELTHSIPPGSCHA